MTPRQVNRLLIVAIATGVGIGVVIVIGADGLRFYSVFLAATTVAAALLGLAPVIEPPKASDPVWVRQFDRLFNAMGVMQPRVTGVV